MHTRAHAHPYTRARIYEVHGGGGRAAHARTDTGWLMEKFSPQRKPLYSLVPFSFSRSLSLHHFWRLCFSISSTVVLSSSLFRVYLMRIESRVEVTRGGSAKPTRGQFETFSARSRGNLGKEAVSRSTDPSPGSRSMLSPLMQSVLRIAQFVNVVRRTSR